MLGQGLKTLVKAIHVLSSALWVGGGLAMLVIALGRDGLVEREGLYLLNRTILDVDNWVTIPGGIASMVTGFFLSAFTSWGFFKHRWIIVKWVLTTLNILAGALLLSVWISQLAELSGLDQAGSAAYLAVNGRFLVAHVVQTAVTIFQLVISVYKPWKGK